MTDELVEASRCHHIDIEQHDSGFCFPEERRDIGLRCNDCGTEWDVQIKKGLEGATIKLRFENPKIPELNPKAEGDGIG